MASRTRRSSGHDVGGQTTAGMYTGAGGYILLFGDYMEF